MAGRYHATNKRKDLAETKKVKYFSLYFFSCGEQVISLSCYVEFLEFDPFLGSPGVRKSFALVIATTESLVLLK